MKRFSRNELLSALDAVGVKQGDCFLVHSSLFRLGLFEDFLPADFSRELHRCLFEVLGPDGTILVPSFFYDYAKKKVPFQIGGGQVSRELGAFTQFVLNQPSVHRSTNPIFSLAGHGYLAEYICGGGTWSAFGYDSPWHRFHQRGGKVLGLGTELADTFTFLHYVDHFFGVPHMYHKFFQTPIIHDGDEVPAQVTAYVRYLDYDVVHHTDNFQGILMEKDLVRWCPLGSGKILAWESDNIFQEAIACLKKNVFFFLRNKPCFKPGQIPLV